MLTTVEDLTQTAWDALWGEPGGYAVVLHQGVEITERVPCRVVVLKQTRRELELTIDRTVLFTFAENVAGVTLRAESDGLVLTRDEPGLVLAAGDSVQFHPHGHKERSARVKGR